MSEGKILAIGHAEIPESIYGNPQLFPSMLPWLFPYGLGGIGFRKILIFHLLLLTMSK